MNDKAFLRYALEQSFLRPQNNAAECVDLQYNTKNSNSYMLVDKRHTEIVPYLLPSVSVKKCVKSAAHDISRNARLFAEYERYKHDLAENIIIPENVPEIGRARKVLDLVTVNRQSAQKKKIAATLIPAAFAPKMKEIHRVYGEIWLQSEAELQKNPEAVDLSLIKDFAQTYGTAMRRFGLAHPLYRLNKKRMRYYLNEAAQILKSHHPLADDFCATHCFYEMKLFGNKVSATCADMLCNMVAQLQRMAHQPQLLTLAQILLADNRKFAKALQDYAAEHKVVDSARVDTIRHSVRKLFKKYALLCYLDSARFAFENKFLNECPEPRHPPLPTVSPTDELRMVSQIVEESYKINIVDGKICKIYNDALAAYEHDLTALQKVLDCKA